MLTRRFSRTLSATYLANFHYTVSHDYGKAIALCEEVINFFLDDDCEPAFKTLCSSVQCSSDMAPLFDSDIQAMLGLVLLYDTIHQKATRSDSNQEHVYMFITATAFAYYIKIRCYHKLFRSLGNEETRQALDTAIAEFINFMKHPVTEIIEKLCGASDLLLLNSTLTSLTYF